MNLKPLVAVLYSLHPMHLCCTSHEVCTQCCAVAAGVRGGRAGTYKCVHVPLYMQVHGQAILAAAAVSTSGGSGRGCKRRKG